MSEVKEDGKVNVKIMKMKARIEEVIRDNSNQKKNLYCLCSPRYPKNLKYIKKNQGTHISKIKNINTFY